MGATFSLADLVRHADDPSYTVTDGDLPCTTHKVEQNFTYMFNVCGGITGYVPTICRNLEGINAAGAIQIDERLIDNPNDDYCFMVGEYSESQTKMSLLDQQDPTKGVSITYYGEYCHTPRTQRKFKIEIPCEDRLNPIPTHALEYSHCSYTITIPSVYGCPLECPVANRHVCGGNGHCAYDVDKKAARCFCNHGYEGSACTTKSSNEANYSPTLLGLIITLFVIIGALVGGIFLMIRQLAAYKEDLSNYQALKGDETETV